MKSLLQNAFFDGRQPLHFIEGHTAAEISRAVHVNWDPARTLWMNLQTQQFDSR